MGRNSMLTKDITIAGPSVEYGKRPRSSIREVFEPVLFKWEETGKITKTTNGFGEELTKVDGEIPPDLEVKTGDRFLFISYDQSALTHGLHKYPAKFFPIKKVILIWL